MELTPSSTPRAAVIMGSDSDWPVMRAAAEALQEFDVAWEARVVSAHRTPEDMVASLTPLPVIGVPVAITKLDGMDALLSIVQMPAGVPVATVAVDGARNAGLLAVRVLGAGDPALRERMAAFQAGLADVARGKDRALQERL